MNSLSGSFTPSKPKKQISVKNPFESLRDVGESVVETATQSSADAVKDMWAQLLGVDKYAAKPASKQSGVLEKGKAQEIKPKEKKIAAEAPMSYFKEIREAGKSGLAQESHEIRQQVQAIVYELQRLATASKQIEKQVAQAIGTGVVKPGRYHATFFEWMVGVVREARKRVENAGAWLATVRKKSGGFNKKNMSHLMSGERSVSNQTG